MSDIRKADKFPRRPWKNLGSRFVSALAMSAICIVPLYLGGLFWAALCMLLGGRMVWEWVRMSDPNPGILGFVIPLLGLLIAVTYLLTSHNHLVLVTVLMTAVLSMGLRLKRKGSLWSGFGTLYILAPILLIIWMRGSEVGFGTDGFQHLFYFILVVIAADTFAYFGGSYFKGPKMAPKLSPNKSWSGFVTGIVGACIIGACSGYVFGFGWRFGGLLAVPVAIISVLGDFLESGLKRKLGVKDSGDLLPGHGGLLDRLDSLMMVIFIFGGLLLLFPNFWGLS